MHHIAAIFIASDTTAHYREAQNVCRSYMHRHPNVRSVFAKMTTSTHPAADVLEGDVFTCTVPFVEDASNMLAKSIQCMRMLQRDAGWDYVLRTNLSSIFHWERTLAMLAENSTHDVIASIVYGGTDGFPTGCGMFLSRRAVAHILDAWDKLEHPILTTLLDDEYIGVLLRSEGASPLSWQHVDYHMTTPLTEIDSVSFHRRCKQIGMCAEERLAIEIPMMRTWIEAWYGAHA